MAHHDLPMLRVHQALREASDIAQQLGADPEVGQKIAKRVIEILGAGTSRWGRICLECRSLIGENDVCPQHGVMGGLPGFGPPLALLIAFDPIQG
jgi:hypothetical protein